MLPKLFYFLQTFNFLSIMSKQTKKTNEATASKVKKTSAYQQERAQAQQNKKRKH